MRQHFKKVSMVRAPSSQARLLAGFETRGRLQEYSRSTLAATVKASAFTGALSHDNELKVVGRMIMLVALRAAYL